MHLLLELTKGRRSAPPGQTAFDFDSEDHPRAAAGGDGKYKGGEFVPKAHAEGTHPPVKLVVHQPAEHQFHDTYTGPRHTYGARNRPIGYSHVPDGYVIGSEKEHPDFRHGTVDYPRPLTDAEMRGYELEEVHPAVAGGLSQKDMRRVDGFLEEMGKEGWEGKEADDLASLQTAYSQGPRACADFLRATRQTNDFSLTVAQDVKIPKEVPQEEEPSQEVLRQIYDGVLFIAQRYKVDNLEALDFADMDEAGKFAYMEATVFPMWEQMGKPAPLSPGYLEFQDRLFGRPEKQAEPVFPDPTPDPTAEPWTIGPDRYQHLKGVKAPWIAEISQVQYARMGKQQKARYDKQRAAEWDASGAVKTEWRDQVTTAYTAGVITLDTPGLSPDARDAIKHFERQQDKARQEAVKAERSRDNRITSIDQVEVGDRVYDIMSGRYCTVLKKFKTGVRLKPDQKEGGYNLGDYTANARQLQWKNGNDLEKGARSKPTEGQGAFDFDSEAHPRAQAGAHDGKYRGGEFVPKGQTGGGGVKQPWEMSRADFQAAPFPGARYVPEIHDTVARYESDGTVSLTDAFFDLPQDMKRQVWAHEVAHGVVKEVSSPERSLAEFWPLVDSGLLGKYDEEKERFVGLKGQRNADEVLTDLVADYWLHPEKLQQEYPAQFKIAEKLAHNEPVPADLYAGKPAPEPEKPAPTEKLTKGGNSKSLILLVKGRKAAPGQLGLFDEEAHPRAAAGAHDDKYRGGEFIPAHLHLTVTPDRANLQKEETLMHNGATKKQGRKDVHRPTEMVPADYNYLGMSYGVSEETEHGTQTNIEWEGTPEWEALGEPRESTLEHAKPGQCDHCGARHTYQTILQHKPTGQIASVGHQCYENRFSVPGWEKKVAEAARKASLQLERETNTTAALADMTEPEQAAYTWALDPEPKDYDPLASDIAQKVAKYGKLSEKQKAVLVRIHQRTMENNAKRAAENLASEECPNGKHRVSGVVLAIKVVDTQFGSTTKMLVKDARGFKVFGTRPAAYGGVEKGQAVEFDAEIERSHDDPYFGFYKRPTKMKPLEAFDEAEREWGVFQKPTTQYGMHELVARHPVRYMAEADAAERGKDTHEFWDFPKGAANPFSKV